MQNLNKIVTVTLAVLALVAVGYLVVSYNNGSSSRSSYLDKIQSPMMMSVENFENSTQPAVPTLTHQAMPVPTHGMHSQAVDASESMQYVEQPQGLNMGSANHLMNQLPSECYPKDVLSSADLLPRDANSLWAQVNPSGQGSLADQNFLTSGFHIGINTVGQTLRNANRQLRSEPLNPQVKVSPWMQTTIEPDINRRPLEIEGDL